MKLVKGNNVVFNKYSFLILLIVWTSFATFRLITEEIGGADSIAYVDYFENCNKTLVSEQTEHFSKDILFKWINQIIRSITSDYHVYYIITYGFIVVSIANFFLVYSPPKTNYIPYVLCFYFFLRSINTFRTSLAISFLLMSLIFFYKKKWFNVVLFSLGAILVHKMMALFVLVIPFCEYCKTKTFDLNKIFVFTVLSYIVANLFVPLFMMLNSSFDLGNDYGTYVIHQEGQSFFDNFWKIAFEQILLFFLMYRYDSRMCRFYSWNLSVQKSYKVIKLICIFDFLIVPICFVMNIWRGYEVFYVPRIVMWGMILYYLFNKNKAKNYFYSIICFIGFELWIVFRVYRTWFADKYMPYFFEPLITFPS